MNKLQQHNYNSGLKEVVNNSIVYETKDVKHNTRGID